MFRKSTRAPLGPFACNGRLRISPIKRRFLSAICALAACGIAPLLRAETLNGNPSSYVALLRQLKPGDTLSLEPGTYPRLYLAGLNGTPDAWITITGPASDPPAVIQGEPNHNTVEIENCSYLSLENLRIDSRGIPGAFGISARGREHNLTHHIRIEGNTLIGQHGGQQTDGISTKTPTWGWVIRYNKILGAGTGLYLGDSDGSQPFVSGVIENNLIKDTIGYDMEIKDQHSIPTMPGMPLGPTSTIIRNNIFIKNDQGSPDGDRPNLLVGAFPETGPGSLNMYEIYGNYFVHNHREALFQGSGRLSLHDNIFVDGPYTYPAVVLRKQNAPLQVALVYNNTVYTSGPGIRFDHPALSGGAVVGNLVFATNTPISGPISFLSDNLTAALENAPAFVHSPSFDLASADFYPLPGKCRGAAIDLTMFQSEKDYTLDFNGTPKTQAKGAVVYRGAYAGEGPNPAGPIAGLKPPSPPRPKTPRVAWITYTAAKAGAPAQLTLTGANFSPGASVTVSGDGIKVADVIVTSETEITASLTFASGATFGTRDVTVTTSMGASNAFPFRLSAVRRQP